MDKRISQMFWTSADISGSNSSLKRQNFIETFHLSPNIFALSQRDIKTIFIYTVWHKNDSLHTNTYTKP